MGVGSEVALTTLTDGPGCRRGISEMSVRHNNIDLSASYTRNSDDMEPLPDFDRPPVSEVALSLQFEPLSNLKGPMLGLLWGAFKDRYPQVEEHPPLEPVIEKFSGPEGMPNLKLQFQVLDAPPPVRVWFVNIEGTELIQVQQDRFVHNWRKATPEDEYPRYTYLRAKLIEELGQFLRFVQEEKLGKIVFNQTEVTFVNSILSGEGWERHGQLDNVLTIHSGHYSDDFFNEPENVQTALRYVIPGADQHPVGRLHISVVPVVSLQNKKPALNLTIIARCAPDGTVEDTLRCLDMCHRWVVKGFASITTKEMHEVWRRQDQK